jgi:hypothetical protein
LSAEKNKALSTRLYEEVFGRGNLAATLLRQMGLLPATA